MYCVKPCLFFDKSIVCGKWICMICDKPIEGVQFHCIFVFVYSVAVLTYGNAWQNYVTLWHLCIMVRFHSSRQMLMERVMSCNSWCWRRTGCWLGLFPCWLLHKSHAILSPIQILWVWLACNTLTPISSCLLLVFFHHTQVCEFNLVVLLVHVSQKLSLDIEVEVKIVQTWGGIVFCNDFL